MEATPTLQHAEALAYQALEILRSRISDGTYAANSRLPAEVALASELGISRATVRRAMDLLVERGLIYRRQGIGTFVTKSPDIKNPLYQFIDFREMLRVQGFRPGLVELSASFVQPEAEICELLGVDPTKPILETHKYFTADDELVVYCVNHIPTWVFEKLMTQEEVRRPGVMEPILEFYEKRCAKKIEYYACTVHADVIKHCDVPCLSQLFKPDTPVLMVDEVGYGKNDQPLHHSIEYHPGNHMQFGLIRLISRPNEAPQPDIAQRAFSRLNDRISNHSR